MLSIRPRSVKPNTRWRSARRRSNEKSARQVQREHADRPDAGPTVGETITAWGRAFFALDRASGAEDRVPYGTGTGPRAQQAKRAKETL